MTHTAWTGRLKQTYNSLYMSQRTTNLLVIRHVRVTSKDSDKPVHPLSTARVPVYPSLHSLEAVKGTCDQRGLIIKLSLRV